MSKNNYITVQEYCRKYNLKSASWIYMQVRLNSIKYKKIKEVREKILILDEPPK